MRTTVLVSEVCLAWGALRYVCHGTPCQIPLKVLLAHSLVSSASNKSLQTLLSLAILLHPGFLILDSIHFQYNGFLFGLMLFSLVGAKEVGLVSSVVTWRN